MSRIGAAFVISILPAAAFCQKDGLSFLTKSAPGVSSSQGSWLYGMDARRRTALIYSDSPELWTSPTYGRQYYLRSFDGLPLERIPIERLAAFPDFLTWPNVTDIRISGDGSAVMIGIRQTGLSERRYVYDRAERVFRPIVLPFSFYPLQVLKGTKVIGRKSGQTISVDLVSGVQQTLAESPYDLASPDGKYLYMRPQPPRSGETAGTASLYNVATGRIRNYRLNGMSPYGTGWFSQDYRFILYFRPGPSQPNLVRLDTLNLAESVFPAPATQGSVLDVFGDKAIFLNASEDSAKIWDLKSGALQPLATLSGNSYPTIRFVTAATVLLSTASPMQDGDRNQEVDVWLGTAATGSWRTAIPPRIGSREAAQAVITADNAFAVTEYAAMGDEAGGKAYGFVRKDMATGTVKSLPGRTVFAGLLQVADGGKKALVQESTTRKLFHRNLDTGVETEIGLDGRDFVTAALAPSGDEAFVFAAKDGARRLFRWTPAGSQDIPLPSGTTRVGHIAFGGGLLALATDFMAYVGPADGSAWKALPLPSGTATVQKTAIPRDGLTVVATFQSHDSAFGFTRVYRASDAKTLKTYAGSELSSDGRWALRLRSAEGTSLYLPTGAVVQTLPELGMSSGADSVGPWLLASPYVNWDRPAVPLAYRSRTIQASKASLSGVTMKGGEVKITAKVIKAGLENAAHTLHFRVDDGAWQTQTADVFSLILPDGPRVLESYVVDALGRRSAENAFATVYADSTPPTILNVRHELSGRNAIVRAEIEHLQQNFQGGYVKIGFTRGTEAMKWYDPDFGGASAAKGFTGLSKGIVYRYQIKAVDPYGNEAISPEQSFTLPN